MFNGKWEHGAAVTSVKTVIKRAVAGAEVFRSFYSRDFGKIEKQMFKSSLRGRGDIFYATEKGSVIQKVIHLEPYNFWKEKLFALKY